MALILPYNGIMPKVDPSAFIAENAVIIGDVEIGADTSIWYGCVLRGDVNHIRIGARTNIQDGTIIHVNHINGPTIIGNGVTVGHQALLHACQLQDHAFVGMGAKVLDYAIVETNAMVAAGAMVTQSKRVPSGELWAGTPAKLFRPLSQEEVDNISYSENNYVELAKKYNSSS
jgi:carbonic anhydrase/acetyltransferase-like protein (isoleucine patch superfamily)